MGRLYHIDCDPPEKGWTHEDQNRALQDGWGIFDHSERGIEIERLDDPSSIGAPIEQEPRFKSDESAEMHVESMASSGSPLHRKAVAYVALNRRRSPEEIAEAETLERYPLA